MHWHEPDAGDRASADPKFHRVLLPVARALPEAAVRSWSIPLDLDHQHHVQ